MHIKLTSVLPEGSLFFRSLTIAAGKEEIGGGGGGKKCKKTKFNKTIFFLFGRGEKK